MKCIRKQNLSVLTQKKYRQIKKYIYCLIIFILLFAGNYTKEKIEIQFSDNVFSVEVAKTRKQQEKGLMLRESLPANSGMLFIYRDESPRSFYMKNVKIPLDIIWMNKKREVVFVEKNIQPANGSRYDTFSPRVKAMYVLEVNAGIVDKIGLKTGDVLSF